jgi:hypothetical protein
MKTIATCKEVCHQKPWCILSLYTEHFYRVNFVCPCSICLVKAVCRNRCVDRKDISQRVIRMIKGMREEAHIEFLKHHERL